MDATIQIKIRPRDGVPPQGRVAWLDRYGVPPTEATIEMTATLAQWETAGVDVREDGSLCLYSGHGIMKDLEIAALAVVTETGATPSTLPASVLAEITARKASLRKQEEEGIAASHEARI